MALSDRDLATIRGRLQPLLDAEARARELSTIVPNARLFVAVCGVDIEFEHFEILNGFARIRKVHNAPGVVHVCRAANWQHSDYLAVSRYSSQVRAEVAVGNDDPAGERNDESFQLDVAWHTAALVKLRGHTTLFCPAAASVSWDTVCAVSDNSVSFQVLDDTPRQLAFLAKPTAITEDDLEWVKANWDVALNLRSNATSRRFGLAFNLAYGWNHTADPRVALANLWFGLEALFGHKTDRPVTSKLISRVCSWLPSFQSTEVRDLYGQRCEAVHGRWLSKPESGNAIAKSADLLHKAIIKCIESKKVPLPDWS